MPLLRVITDASLHNVLVGFASQKDNGTSLIDMKMTHDCMESRCT